MKRDMIVWAMTDIADDLIREAQEVPMMKKRISRPLRIALIAAAVAVMMTATVLGAYAARHWDEVLTNVFHIGESEQAVVDSSVTDVYATAERNGCVYTIKQVMGDKHCMVVSLDVKLPDDITLPTITTAELKSLAEQYGLNWSDVVSDLHLEYGYDETDEILTGVTLAHSSLLVPVDMGEEEIRAGVDAYYVENPDYPDEPGYDREMYAISYVLNQRMLEEFQADTGDLSSIGSGTIYEHYDAATNTLSYLTYMDTSNTDNNGQTCTMVLRDLKIQDIGKEYFELYGEPTDPPEQENLLPEPLILHFTANYEPISQEYDIQHDGVSVGTMELSPFSAYLTFPMEPDKNEYSSLDETIRAYDKKDFLGNDLHSFEIVLTDGAVATMQMRFGGISGDSDFGQKAFFITDQVIDLEQVEFIKLKDYTFSPR